MDGQNPKKLPPGWVWIAGIVIVAAVVLAIIQQGAPSNKTNQTNNQASTASAISVVVPNVPQSLTAGTIVGISWAVNAPAGTTLTQTEAHWDSVSHPGDFDTSVTSATSGYSGASSAYASGSFSAPQTFEDNIKVDDSLAGGVLYLRINAISDGKNYWSPEYAIPVLKISQIGNGGGGS